MTRGSRPVRRSLFGGFAATALFALASNLSAQTSGACFVPGSGTIYRIGNVGPAACVDPSHVSLFPFFISTSATSPIFDIKQTGTGTGINVRADGGSSAIAAYANGNFPTAFFENTGTSTGLHVRTANSPIAFFEATGTGGGLTVKTTSATAGNFQSDATGNVVTLLAIGKGTFPVAQFNHSTGGIALRTIGAADIVGGFSVTGSTQLNGNLTINGSYTATGTKSAIVKTNDGVREVYSEESTEVWFADYGFGQLTHGRAWIPIDSNFASTIAADAPYHVFVQSYGDMSLVVTKRTATGFEVSLPAELRTQQNTGNESVEFSYRLVAKRRGFEDRRLRRAVVSDSVVKGMP